MFKGLRMKNAKNFTFSFSILYLSIHILMSRSKRQTSKTLTNIFGGTNDREVSKKLIQKLVQYNMKYEEITKVILSHSERAFLDARLITLEEYYEELKEAKQSEITSFLASLPEIRLVGSL